MSAKQTSLAEVPVGTNFKVWDKEFTVLEYCVQGVLVLSTQVEDEMPFREDGDEYAVAVNDFRDSTVRRWLNNDYLEELEEAGAEGGDIRDFIIDLKCTLGQHEYGKDMVKVGLLTLEQYGEYFDIIPFVDNWWWLATPMTTPLHAPLTSSVEKVWYVDTFGSCSSELCFRSRRVRPALILSHQLSVSWGPDGTNELEKYSTDDLLIELKRRTEQ